MSDIDGRDAFDNVMERLLDEREQRIRQNQDRDEARRELSLAQQRIRELERDLGKASADITRWKALVPPDVLAKAEKDDEIPF
ncbi:hypothetical protein [Bosea minatitlanensis]|uniref:Uncharacterized protein n=1 Tax=Bosea minatitlanensis TaxID=128782 RepID=A0ABW0F0M7_9HYPH|nr:hypothetical protein [Bosea minatitlanensis]MCT4492770.1 hypothetical protein [Bosea minatitlanensis]